MNTLKTIKDYVNLPTTELEAKTLALDSQELKVSCKCIVDTYQNELKEIKKDKEEICKSYNMILETINNVINDNKELTAEDKKYFLDKMIDITREKEAILDKYSKKRNNKIMSGITIGGAVLLLLAYLKKKN